MLREEDDEEKDDELKKVPFAKYLKFCQKHFANPKNKALRFGQAFYNEFYPEAGSNFNPLLYEEKDVVKAREMIYKEYLDFGEE